MSKFGLGIRDYYDSVMQQRLMNPKASIVLKALLGGQTVKLGDYHCVWDDGLKFKGKSINDGVESDILLGLEVPLDVFVAWCDNVSDDQIEILVMKNMAQPGKV